MPIPNHLKELINYVIAYVDGQSDDWLTIRKEIIQIFKPHDRKRFTRRHYSSKKPILNDFDHEVIAHWKEQTGVTLVIDHNKLHPASSWSKPPRGWGLWKINEERKAAKIAKLEQEQHERS